MSLIGDLLYDFITLLVGVHGDGPSI